MADTKEAKEGRPQKTAALKAWRRGMRAVLGKTELTRLQGIAQRVEALWALAQRRLEVAEAEIRRAIPIWGADDLPAGTGAVQREQIEASLTDPASAYRRLRRVMDAWAALWFWPVTTPVEPPTREQWIDRAGGPARHGLARPRPSKGRGMWGADTTWAELDDAEHNEIVFGQMKPVDDVLAAHPWLGVCERIAEREGFFHWELDFAPVFARGGFDLQVGNPPWVRPDWDDNLVLAEDDAWFGLADKPSVALVRERREQVLDEGDERYLDERASLAGTSAHLGSNLDRPLLAGTAAGSLPLLHGPHVAEHGTERSCRADPPRIAFHRGRGRRAAAGDLPAAAAALAVPQRAQAVRDSQHPAVRCSDIRLAARAAVSSTLSSLYRPETLDAVAACTTAVGPEPGIKDDEDRWDTRPHAARLVPVDEQVLATWAALIDEPGTPPARGANAPADHGGQSACPRQARCRAAVRRWCRSSGPSAGTRTTDRTAGYFVARSVVPESLDDVILQGPHFTVATPYARQPQPDDAQQQGLHVVGSGGAWRSVRSRAPTTNGPSRTRITLLAIHVGTASRPIGSGGWRGDAWPIPRPCAPLHAALLPPGPMHVHGVLSLDHAGQLDLAVAAGMWASLPVDFLRESLGRRPS